MEMKIIMPARSAETNRSNRGAAAEHDGRPDRRPFSAASREIRAHLASKGTRIGPYDVFIAGQARARALTLVTHNAGEFRRVPGLKIEDWKGSTPQRHRKGSRDKDRGSPGSSE